MKTIYIVTGAAGFLGNNVIRLLEQDPEAQIRSLALPNEGIDALDGLRCTVFRGDVTRPETLEDIFRMPAGVPVCVIHCAAVVYIKARYNPAVYEVNVNGTKHVMQKVLEIGAKFIYVSSVHAIREQPNRQVITETTRFDPTQVEGQYAKTKAETARNVLEMVEKAGLDACIVHPSGMIGPYDYGRSHLTQLIIDAATGRLKMCVKGGYDFVDVRDVTEGILRASRCGKRGECYILSNRYVEVQELLSLISQARGRKPVRMVLPMWLAQATAPLSECYYALLRQPPLYTRYSLYTLQSNSNFSNAKAKRELGYETRPLEETVQDTIWWLEAQKRI